jgi:tetratricopeptide (TPR) repeat protein
MKAAFAWVVRLLVLLSCLFVTAESVRWAIADWLTSTSRPEDAVRAARIDPDAEESLARSAIVRSSEGDLSPAVDEELRRALALNPLDSDVLMALGLREELRGNDTRAEDYLRRAVEVDHQFRPAWTLANYYYRANQPEKFWPMVARCLNLDPLAFDPTPVFDLLWNETTDSKKIRSLISGRGLLPVQYLNYLIETGRVGPAVEVWPEAFAAARAAIPPVYGPLKEYPGFLEEHNRLPAAVDAWNELVDAGINSSGRLDPKAGVSVADPGFRFPPSDTVFGWQILNDKGVAASLSPGSLRIELDGNEAESVRLLQTVAPVLPGRRYRLVWAGDGKDLNSASDPGFVFQVVQQPGNSSLKCPLFAPGSDAACTVDILPESRDVRIELHYVRALGTTRAQGVLRISSVRLEFAS